MASRPSPSHLAPMLAVPGGLPADPQAFAFEYKWDGMRALVEVRAGRLRIWSRNGLEQQLRFPELAGLAGALKGHDVLLDGEIVAFDAKGRPDFGRLQNRFGLKDPRDIATQAKAHPTHFLAFDVLRLDGRDLTRLPYQERRRVLESLRLEGDSWGTTPSHVGAGQAMLQLSRDMGLEGVMAKRLDSPYLSGDRSPAWLKVRNRNRQEFVVGGWSEGAGTREGTFGALLVGVHEGPRRSKGKPQGAKARAASLRYMGRVGSGYRADDLARLQQGLDSLAAAKSPFAALPPEEVAAAGVHFVKPRLVVEVEFNGLSRHGALRQASFKGLRTDKDAGGVVWEQAEVNGTWQERSGADPSVLAS